MASKRRLHICCTYFDNLFILIDVRKEEFIVKLHEFFMTDFSTLYWMDFFFLIAGSLELFKIFMRRVTDVYGSQITLFYIIIVRYGCLLSQAFSTWYFS